MLFIMDILPMMKILKSFQGKCDTCQREGNIELIKTYQCFRLFFIPLFKWQVKYYLKHSCGGQIEVNEEVALRILHGIISTEHLHMEHEKVEDEYGQMQSNDKQMAYGQKENQQPSQVNDRCCSHCGKALETQFEYCPYCGMKRR